MAVKDQLLKEKFSHTGVFDFTAFYRYIYNWFQDKNYQVLEEKYSETLSGNKRNINFEWKATKEFSDYFKIEIALKAAVTGLTDVEVETDGEKKKMHKGGVAIELKGLLIYDPSGAWEKEPWWRFVRDVYNKYVIPNRVDSMQEITKADVETLKEEMKSFLELYGKR